MSEAFEKAMQSALNGELSADERAALNDALRSDPAALDAYCRQLRVDALLAWRTGAVTAEKVVAFSPRRRVLLWVGWAAAALVMVGAVFFVSVPLSASAAVSRMLAAMQRGDRSYAITVTEGDAQMVLRNDRTLTYEGAALHLREGRQFVLVRPLGGGGQRITGSNGTVNWDIIGDGPVKVSRDLTRFRGGLPGEQQDAPFLDLAGQLTTLKGGYDIALHDAPGEPAHARLAAVKKSQEIRGPREMEIIFRRDSGVILSLELRGLPRAKGGPESLRLTLIAESPLPADFFNHIPHHESERRVEDSQRSP